MSLAWLPNCLTIIRIGLVPFVVIAIFDARYALAFVLFFVAGLSDLLDGYLARRFGWQSRLGSLLDPIADKLMFIAVFASLASLAMIPWWLALLVVLRDLIIVTGASVYNFTVAKLEGAASLLGKLNTLVQGLYVLSVLSAAATGHPPAWVLRIGALLVVLSVLVSGTHYVIDWSRRARQSRNL